MGHVFEFISKLFIANQKSDTIKINTHILLTSKHKHDTIRIGFQESNLTKKVPYPGTGLFQMEGGLTMAGSATNVDHNIAEMIRRGANMVGIGAQAKQAIDAAKVAAEGAKAIKVDTTYIDAAVEATRATRAQANQALEACNASIARVKAITPAKA